MKLGIDGKEVISYCELLGACESMGVVKNSEEASAFAKVMDDAGDILLLRDKVYLYPDKNETKKYYFLVANAKFMLDEEEHFQEQLFERLRFYGEHDKEKDFWLLIELSSWTNSLTLRRD
ncbi:unnamed protein product [Lupinus luteus]|uniref:Uncharacterized protein n=1 Tax=Lupinus luteus TaxID=3873 RepID=A0AAV1WEZ4_LUPLU